MSILGSLMGKSQNKPEPTQKVAAGLPAPEQPIFVIGDLHGRIDLFEKLLEQIDIEIGSHKLTNPKLVFVGNLIDHGPSSAALISRMRSLTQEFPNNVACLLGNHEQMCLDFLDAPLARFARWMKGGAAATFESYQVPLPVDGLTTKNAQEAADMLREAIGGDVIAWMRALPSIMSSGTLHVVHAAADPRRAMTDQSARVLTWGHPEFLTVARSDGQWVAHGHTPTERPSLSDSRISVDTEAWRSGTLSSAMILPSGQVEFVQASL